MQPSRRPKDGRYGENPNRLQHYYQFQVVLKPSPPDILDLYLGSLEAVGFDLKANDVRFVEDDWENPTLGAWGLGWEVWMNGMEITQFTYFQQVGGLDCKPITGEITYGLERLAMYLQGVENVYDLVWTEWQEGGRKRRLTYRDVYHQNEVEQSTYNFEQSDTESLFRHFGDHEKGAKHLMAKQLGAARLRAGAQGRAHLQPAGRARRDLRHRARGLHRAHPQPREGGRAELLRVARAPGLPDAGRGGRAMSAKTLLVELFTEELPPEGARAPGRGVRRRLEAGLAKRGFLARGREAPSSYATPRRLAAAIAGVRGRDAAARSRGEAHARRRRPRRRRASVTPALGRSSRPRASPASIPRKLKRRMDGKAGDALRRFHRARRAARRGACRPRSTRRSRALPIPKVMSYQLADGITTVQFVRPAHGLVALHGDDVVPVKALGLDAGRTTHGHRFEGAQDIVLAHADEYAARLARKAASSPRSPRAARQILAQLRAGRGARGRQRSGPRRTSTRCSTR